MQRAWDNIINMNALEPDPFGVVVSAAKACKQHQLQPAPTCVSPKIPALYVFTFFPSRISRHPGLCACAVIANSEDAGGIFPGSQPTGHLLPANPRFAPFNLCGFGWYNE